MSTPENLPQVFEDDSIDLIALLKQIYQGRKLIILSAFVAAILGVVVALTTPNTYTSVVTFIPQSGGDSKPSSSLSGLASLAGISLGGMGGGSDIPHVSGLITERGVCEASTNGLKNLFK